MKRFLLLFVTLNACFLAAQEKHIIEEAEKTHRSQWDGKKVAYLGDSMTDPNTRVTSVWYWQYLKELMNIDYCVYARSGFQWDGIYRMAEKLYAEEGDAVDAVFIWAGTNDYNHSTPIGSFFTETLQETVHNGQTVRRKHRTPVMTDSTFCGRINKTLSFLKEHYPSGQIVILTPIHRGYAMFGSNNVQPDENYANALGLYVETYVEALKEAGIYWAVPVIDLYSLSGLYPLSDAFTQYFTNEKTDRLHPNANGHYRIAKTIQYQLLALPGRF
jgi:lysophospholipase L1-like esterase